MTTLKGVLEGVTDPSTCVACGAKFSCGASLAECWCSELTLSDEARAELWSRYRECLCSECLSSASVLEKRKADIATGASDTAE